MTEGGFASAVPAARVHAAEQSVRTNDRSSIPQLVELLQSDDSAVRFTAIAALKRMTGETFGFHPEDPPAHRQQSIAQWVAAVESNSVPQAAHGGNSG